MDVHGSIWDGDPRLAVYRGNLCSRRRLDCLGFLRGPEIRRLPVSSLYGRGFGDQHLAELLENDPRFRAQ